MSATDSGIDYTVDVVLLARDATGAPHVLLIRRSDDSDAFPGHWALPGGYREPGESAEQSARRELLEETHLEAPPELTELGTYDDPARDPRGRVVSTAYVAVLGDMPTPLAGDDASEAEWVRLSWITEDGLPLAFDHLRILLDAVIKGSSPALRRFRCLEPFSRKEICMDDCECTCPRGCGQPIGTCDCDW